MTDDVTARGIDSVVMNGVLWKHIYCVTDSWRDLLQNASVAMHGSFVTDIEATSLSVQSAIITDKIRAMSICSIRSIAAVSRWFHPVLTTKYPCSARLPENSSAASSRGNHHRRMSAGQTTRNLLHTTTCLLHKITICLSFKVILCGLLSFQYVEGDLCGYYERRQTLRMGW